MDAMGASWGDTLGNLSPLLLEIKGYLGCCYGYGKAGNSKITYNHGNTGTAVWCFSRSVNYNNTNNFCMTNTDGSANNANAYNSGGRAPGFHNPHFGV